MADHNHRKLFIPKLPELPEKCESCPFRDGNDAEFSVIVARIAVRQTDVPIGKMRLALAAHRARHNIRVQVSHQGEFHCHHTAYDRDMNVRPEREHRQCPGATEFYISALEPD